MENIIAGTHKNTVKGVRKKSKENKIPIIERICRVIDLPPESLSRAPHIEIHGRTVIKIHDGGKILLYTPERIRIALPQKNGIISVLGENLRCVFYNFGAVGIEGIIGSVCFEDGE